MIRRALRLAAPLALPALVACSTGPVDRWDTTQRAGVAVGGYDPVTYFVDGEAREGNPAITADWEGVTWQFTSDDNLAAFEDDPEFFAPRYGGWCAWSMRWNRVVESDPKSFSVDGDRLYLFNNPDARDQWKRNPARFRKIADRNWRDADVRE